jgi:hypothetical protein
MKTYLIIILSFLTLSCSSIDINTYKDNSPKLDLKTYFSGDLTAHGIIKDRSGKVIRYFNVDMQGTWNKDGIGILKEKFIFDDGSIDYRTWTFSPFKNNNQVHYLAKANDTLAPVPISISGNAFFMNYDLLIDYEGNEVEVRIEDKMYLINNAVMINESTMIKYGLDVGYITLTIVKSSL